MAINTDALTLGSSLPAQSSFQTRASGPGSSQVANDQNPDPDRGSQPGSAAATRDSGSNGPAQSASTTQKPTGPSAQTRANARTNEAPANTHGTNGTNGTSGTSGTNSSTATSPSSDSAAATDDANADFGSAMATALGRSATRTANAPPAANAPAGAATSSTPTQPAAAPPADAVAWIAQILTPAAAAAQPAAIAGNGKAGGGSASAGSVTGTAAASGGPATAAATLLPGLPAAGDAAAALRTDNTLPQTAAAQSGAAQTPPTQSTQPTQPTQAAQSAQSAAAAPTLGSINAMAEVQKLISGMTAANTAAAGDDTGTDAGGAPGTHAATTIGSTDPATAAAALQASGLTRDGNTLGSATLTIQSPVGSAAFADEVSSQVTGLAQSGIAQAQLQLSPAGLGPVQVHITLEAGQASVWFGANHADTRAALEQSLPRLRELFAGAGMPLTDSGVFREPPQPQQTPAPAAAGSSRLGGGDTLTTPTVTQVSNIQLSLLDTYA